MFWKNIYFLKDSKGGRRFSGNSSTTHTFPPYSTVTFFSGWELLFLGWDNGMVENVRKERPRLDNKNKASNTTKYLIVLSWQAPGVIIIMRSDGNYNHNTVLNFPSPEHQKYSKILFFFRIYWYSILVPTYVWPWKSYSCTQYCRYFNNTL